MNSDDEGWNDKMNRIVDVRDLEKYIDNSNSISLHMDMSMNVLLWESVLL